MRRPRGFTLLELMVVLVVAGILAALAGSAFRAATRNAGVSSASFDLAMRLAGLRAKAMSEGRDLVLVFVDAPGSDASQCTWLNTGPCARYFVLANPAATFGVAGFSPSSPAANAEYVDVEILPAGVHLDTTATFTPPAPFSSVAVHDTDLTATCASGASKCFAVRFTRRGVVAPVYAGASTPTKLGYGFVLGTDLRTVTSSANRHGIVVSFPAGIVKTATTF